MVMTSITGLLTLLRKPLPKWKRLIKHTSLTISKKNVLEDVKSYAVSEGVELSEEQASKVANLYISGKYDCNEGYWTNIQTLINEVTERA